MTRVAAIAAALSLAGLVAGLGTSAAVVSNAGDVTITVGMTLTTPTTEGPVLSGPMPGTLTGTVDGDGNISIPESGISFPPFDAEVVLPVTLEAKANGPWSGAIDPDTGRVSIGGSMTVLLDIPDLATVDCPIGPFSAEFDSQSDGGVLYDAASASATVVDPAFSVDVIPPGTCGGVEAAINDQLQLPRDDAGPLAMTMTFSPALQGEPTPPGAPTAVDDTATTPQDNAVTIDVLANDVPNEERAIDVSTLVVAVPTESGALADPIDGKIRYTPPIGFNGTDTFRYRICSVPGEEGTVDCDTARVTVTVEPPVGPTETTAPPGPGPTQELPRTGSTSGALAVAGFAMLLAGAGALALRRSHARRTRFAD